MCRQPREEEEDLQEALSLVNQWVREKRAFGAIELKLVHSIIARHLHKVTPGEYRGLDVRRDGLTYPHAFKLESAMERFFAWIAHEEYLISVGSCAAIQLSWLPMPSTCSFRYIPLATATPVPAAP
jgi:hypothetical protein